MDDYITKGYLDLELNRIKDEDARQNKRLDIVESDIRDLQRMTTAVEKLAVNMETMSKEQTKMATKLDAIEAEPADNWKRAVWLVVAALIGAAVAYFLQGGGMV